MSALAAGSTLAQESKTASLPTKAKQEQEEARVLRRTQLRVLKESALTRVVDSIKSMDEAALRISARNQLITHLSGGAVPSEEHKLLAARIAADAIADFSEHSEEIPPFMADYLLSDLGAWIQKYQPQLIEPYQAAEKKKKSNKESDRIRALLQLKGGDTLAARRIRQLFEEGQDVDGLNFYLDDLRKHNSKEFEPLLSEIVNVAERGQQVSLQTLFWVSDIYLQAEMPLALKRRFLAMIITRTQPTNFAAAQAPQSAYDLLVRVLPVIQKLSPELYDQAVAQSFGMRATLNEKELATEERNKRLKESLNPLEDLIAEADATKSKVERNELLAGAARLAMEAKKFALCLEVVSKLDLDMAATISTSFWRNWADQFLKEFVKATLTAKETELAERGAALLNAPLARVEALVLIMRYWVKADDKTPARLLAEASKIAAGTSDNIERAKAFFLLSISCDQTDESQKAGLLEAAIKALNDVSKPDPRASDTQPYQQYVRNLDSTGYQLTRGFKELTKKDENGAVALVEKIQKPDLRTFAAVGVLLGVTDLLAKLK